MTTAPNRMRHLTPSLVISLLALVIATSSGAYAVVKIGAGEIHTRHLADRAVTTAKIHGSAVTGSKVKNFSLHLVDFGGRDHRQSTPVNSPVSIPADECRQVSLNLYNPAPAGVIGSLAVGYVTDADGGAVLSNSGVVVPTMVSETSQGGAIVNLVVCARGPETIPQGSVFHYQLIGPGK